ncbi:gamma carbonic anhydrase family protein [Maritalea porphyrae]|uniref:gamma carbonic anhydrase family protein n=1 Tax=Maritalea porphyrae TaxID=880732 RepID=UPI0022AE84A5|nr:gamma carbonic anhydrase family protein [Maritalea porphyrae]MCZ4272782.1 gamma carbonic anhydrase family protein [Maritalea porphyrae]
MQYSFDGIAPTIAADAYVSQSADLIGNVIAKSKANIWFGSVLRGDIEPITIGENANVQDLSVIHTDAGFPVEIGAHCTIGHRAILHGCLLEEGVLVGMGATVMNGCVIGRGSIIGAGAVVTEGQQIPPFSMVLGMPGKIKKQLDPSTFDDRIAHAMGYVNRGQHYLNAAKVL